MEVEEIYADFINGTLAKYTLPDSSYLIPTNMDPISISKMINDILTLEEPVVFDIILNGQPLRTTVAECLEEREIKSEKAIKIMYTLALLEPKVSDVDDLNSWIPSISQAGAASVIGVCCYDGEIRLYGGQQLNDIKKMKFEDVSTSALALYASSINPSTLEVVCGHMDGHLKFYRVDLEDNVDTLVTSNEGREDTITALAIDTQGQFVVAGGFDNAVDIYDNRLILQYHCNGELDNNTGKRSLTNAAEIPPLGTIKCHTKYVTDIKFPGGYTSNFFTSSMDGSLTICDATSCIHLTTLQIGRAITSFDISPNSSRLCTGHDDGSICFWDIRGSDDSPLDLNADVKGCSLRKGVSFFAFERLVSAIKWHPKNEHLVALTSLDGHILVLDCRSPKTAVFKTILKIDDERDGGTCCLWSSESDLIVTTATGCIKGYNFDNLN